MTTILIVEDDTIIRSNLAVILSEAGYETLTAPDGLQGLAAAIEYLPDLILCDLMMPGLDGFEVLDALRKRSTTASIPVIILTALDENSTTRRAMSLGADDYISKPFSPPDLLDAIRSRLARRTQLSQEYEQRMEDMRASIMHALPHEVRTSLTGILGYTEFLRMVRGDDLHIDQVKDIMAKIEDSANRLRDVTERYLTYIHLQGIQENSEQLAVFRKAVACCTKATITNSATRVAQACGRSADLQQDVESGAICISDPYLEMIVLELVDNACKFSRTGGAVRVQGRPNLVRGVYQLSITDYGQGMTRADINRIGALQQFDRVYNEQQGLGLGLAIVKRLIALHAGSLTITSEPNQGSTFYVTLPMVRPSHSEAD